MPEDCAFLIHYIGRAPPYIVYTVDTVVGHFSLLSQQCFRLQTWEGSLLTPRPTNIEEIGLPASFETFGKF